MKVVHGSASDLTNSDLGNNFRVFDYRVENGKIKQKQVLTGDDTYGPGVYAYLLDQEKYPNSTKWAESWTGDEHGGFLYFLSLDIEEEQLMNNQSSDAISVETWVDIINLFIKKRNEQAGYSFETLESKINDMSNAFGEDGIDARSGITQDDVNIDFESFIDNGLELDGELSPFNFSNYEDWFDSVRESYNLYSPCGHIDITNVIDSAIKFSDDLWGTTVRIWNEIAIETSGLGHNTYNETFQKSVLEIIGDSDQFVAANPDKGIVVVFNTDKIHIEKVIELTDDSEYEHTL